MWSDVNRILLSVTMCDFALEVPCLIQVIACGVGYAPRYLYIKR